ncbi:GNAT family N-acetyltransferase [Aneurinibacillus migulanus]|uniref:Acetyltransferase (GNAT) domain-containing protein n=1 Tax=Aneurinibacillus migulanus TaxID=47500 RepID=A0A0D1W2X4_ANEMI|nr:GNAT family N-acetyltransferase [Aneurinibacillus migulanus]KIV52770.1 hypothetical protein TS65_21765 [Aneurinibacillus migulanus]KON95037.1 hypothetical protein AF333_05620 [Aneurinibacillus migulanus]MED0896524.1 GNAT family N-acetyltransferase [Aneurinibacillus migulanus]MED1614939.1 GNAT family N-acetyltransferase [Aneurinibacillus migulanus]SDJ42851.1 Acetyltransferase (GNAT) domain-containing protein [Aneurinibacillus migulanus]
MVYIDGLRPLQETDLLTLEKWFENSEIASRMEGMLPLKEWYNHISKNFLQFIRIAYTQQNPVGIIQVEKEEDIGYISLIVNPSFWNKGYGKTILCKALEQPEFRSIRKWKASIEEDNISSLKCFKSVGFIEEDANPDEDGFFDLVYSIPAGQ